MVSRPLARLVVLVATLAAAACASPTAPKSCDIITLGGSYCASR